jgi:imidazolonepropionase-like amidohydrolase
VIVFRDVSVVDGQFDDLRPALDVTVDGARIVGVEAADPTRSIPDGATVIDGSGSSLLPGLVDCHVHYALDPTSGDGFGTARDETEAAVVVRAAGTARRALEAGVTTARSGGSKGRLDILLRDAIAAGHVLGPRLLAAGPALTITGGHGREYGREVDGPDRFVGAVRANVRDGADVVSVVAGAPARIGSGGYEFDEMSQAELEAVVLEATRHGRRVMSHAENTESVERSVWAGVASVEGGFLADETVQSVLIGTGTTYVPLLVTTEPRRDPSGSMDGGREQHRKVGDLHRRTTEAAIELGVRVAAGTGCGLEGVTPEMLATEVRLLHEHGARPIDAVRAATQWAAELLGLDGEIGIVQPGFVADLILVDGNPLTDLRRLERPSVVVQGGRIVRRAS